MKLLHIAIAAVLCLWAASAQANPAAEGGKVDKFALMDTNKDGKVTYEEFKAYFPNMREEALPLLIRMATRPSTASNGTNLFPTIHPATWAAA